MRKLTQSDLDLRSKHKLIVSKYVSASCTVESIAKEFNISPRQIQRIVTRAGVGRTQAESNRLMAKYKNYRQISPELRVKRKQLSNKQRYIVINRHPYCVNCGMRPDDGVRLEIDHINENPQNNHITNLQVLCGKCNSGKSHLARFGASVAPG